jgi:glycosyltransferase involved in cell wall biosynthesis
MKISVCIPVYDVSPRYLAALLDSIAVQDHDDYEIVIGDDRSSVAYDEVLRGFPRRHRVRYHRNATNLGMVANWNATVQRANGELAVVLGHDDVIAPGMFSAYASTFAESDEIVLVSSASTFIDGDGRPSDFRTNVNHRSNIFVHRPRYVLNGREVTRLCLRNGSALGELSVHMFRLAHFRAVGGYDGAFHHAADLDLAVRVAQRGLTIYLNQPYLLRRMHADNLTWRHLATGHVTADRARLFEKNRDKYPFSATELAQFKAYLVACACYDIVRLPRHKSVKAAARALTQIPRYASVHPSVYRSALTEILSRRNQDVR